MDKKKIIVIGTVTLITIPVIVLLFNKNNKIINNNENVIYTDTDISLNVTNNIKGGYDIYDDNGMLIGEEIPEDMLILYEDNPNYNPNPTY